MLLEKCDSVLPLSPAMMVMIMMAPPLKKTASERGGARSGRR